MTKTLARSTKRSRVSVERHALRQLGRLDWDAMPFESRRDAAEVLHTLAYALVSGDSPLLAKLRVAAVAEIRKHLSPAGETWDDHAERWGAGPIVVTGGPVYSTHKQTQELDALIAGMSQRMKGGKFPFARPDKAWALMKPDDCARAASMWLIANVPSRGVDVETKASSERKTDA